MYRGVIQARDIIGCENGQVTYRFRHSETKKMKLRTVSGAAFARAWRARQSALNPEAAITGRHFSISARRNFSSPSGVEVVGSVPVRANFSFTSACPSAIRSAWCSTASWLHPFSPTARPFDGAYFGLLQLDHINPSRHFP